MKKVIIILEICEVELQKLIEISALKEKIQIKETKFHDWKNKK